MPLTVRTAEHIDYGKTWLVRRSPPLRATSERFHLVTFAIASDDECKRGGVGARRDCSRVPSGSGGVVAQPV